MTTTLHWNSVLLELSRRDHSQGYAGGQQGGPTKTSRAMAIAHLAIYNAVTAKLKPEKFYPGTGADKALKPHADTPAAQLGDLIDGAASMALKALYPRQNQIIDDAVSSDTGSSGFKAGQAMAMDLLEYRSGDGSDIPNQMPKSSETNNYGHHKTDPFDPTQPLLGPKWGNVKRFVPTGLSDDQGNEIKNMPLAPFPGANSSTGEPPGSNMTTGAPNGNLLTEQLYMEDFEEVYAYGALDSVVRTPEQTLIGLYWGYDGAQGLGVPPRLYNQIARTIIRARGISDELETAELLAKVNVAMADAGIDAWHYKFRHNLWRPVVGIRNEVHSRGDAKPDPFWKPLGAPQTNRPGTPPRTPGFPAYPSGHATFGAALFQILAMHKGGPKIDVDGVLTATRATTVQTQEFKFISDELDGVAVDADGSVRTRHEREFKSYAYAVQENAISRVYLGVHWRFDGLPAKNANTPEQKKVGGVPLGLDIGEVVHKFFEGLSTPA